jgi:hypothetical protein
MITDRWAVSRISDIMSLNETMTTATTRRWLLIIAIVLCTDRVGFTGSEKATLPASPAVVRIRAASPIRLPGSGVDSNSPAHWDGDRFYVFTSWFSPKGHADRSEGEDLFQLGMTRRAEINNDSVANGGRWLEATQKLPDGTLYGWYHNEPEGVCSSTRLTEPRIGAMKSSDNGADWIDLGIVLEAPAGTVDCSAENGYFAGGHGDFSVVLDQSETYFYFFFSSYVADNSQQGIAVARMAYADRDQPVGNVWKWHNRVWDEAGLGGSVTPIFRANRFWKYADPDALWGPSVHFNTYLQAYVMLLNRTTEATGNWRSEGNYITYNGTLSNPELWSTPEKIIEGSWYPQVIGTNVTQHETDKLAGQVARLFIYGYSEWEIWFVKRPIILAGGRTRSEDGRYIWIEGLQFAEDSYIGVRSKAGDQLLAVYRTTQLIRYKHDSVQVMQFRLSEDSLQQLLAGEGLRIWVVNPQDATWSQDILIEPND